MANPTIFIDGDKKRIYEVPDLSSFTVDGSGYRIYAPTTLTGRLDEFVQLNFQKDVWSVFQDWHKNNEWSTIAICRSGGSSRGLVGIIEVFASNDYSILTVDGWKFVPANYAHTLEIFGNILSDVQNISIFDPIRLTSIGVLAYVRMADSLQTVVITSGSGLTTAQDTKLSEVHGQGFREIYIDTSIQTNGNGYQKTPYNNWPDAIDDAELNGITGLVLMADAVIDRDIKNFLITGIGLPTIDLAGFNLKGCKFIQCKLEGVFIEPIIVIECVLLANSWLNGYYQKCTLKGDSFCVDGSEVTMDECLSGIAGLGRPSISMNQIGTCKLSARAQRGGLDLRDCNQATDEATIEMLPGSVSVSPSCTLGTIVLRGVGVGQINTTADIVTNEMLSLSTIAKYIWDYATSLITVAGSIGTHIFEELLTFKKYISGQD